MQSKARRKKRPFFMVSSELYNWGLTRNGQDVYVFLCKTADNNDGTCFPGKKSIAANCRIGLTSVYKALKELEAIGLVTIEPRFEDGHQKSNLYTVYDSPGEAFPQPPENSDFDDRINVPPHSHEEPLPIHEAHPYPFTEHTPTRSRGEHGTISNELNSFNYGGGEAAQTPQKNICGDTFKEVRLADAERIALVNAYGEIVTTDYINRLDAYLAAKGNVYRSHYAAIVSWIKQDKAVIPHKRSGFANFKQREFDTDKYEKLERAYRDQKRGENKRENDKTNS